MRARAQPKEKTSISVMAEEANSCTSPSKDKATQAEIRPTIAELQRLLYSKHSLSSHHVNEVWPNLFLGDLCIANDRYEVWKLGITHILNAAHGNRHSQGSHGFYGASITYHGVPANDSPKFDISKYFYSASEFIHKALSSPGDRVLVHCAVGVSRSATLVLAYLMIQHQFSLTQAIQKVQENRWICPNRGFLRQLLHLDEKLQPARNKCSEGQE
ncbi:dual specificity protein phosphatase 13A-like [Hyperolius riggenbachi]|uniref:dual specificity protein phosphatase 13A-like n=1 Tax=Hyperolius riggenbachi TaxID=752182 RepID=UPI0035A3BC40